MDDPFSEHGFLRGVDAATLSSWIARQRWFGGKARTVKSWAVRDTMAAGGALLLALGVTYTDGEETYLVPLGWAPAAPEEAIVFTKGSEVLCDATVLPEFRDWLFRALVPGVALRRLFREGELPPSRVLKAEQSNTALIYGERLFVKLYRRLVAGANPDAELTQFLSEASGFRNVCGFGGTVTWGGSSVALATELTANKGDAWPLALAAAREFYATGKLGDWLGKAALLGRRTGEMHTALAAATGEDFVAEPFDDEDLRGLRAEIARLESTDRTTLAGRIASLSETAASLAQRYLASPAERFHIELPDGAVKTRIHGDYHLGQVLWTGADFVIIDFEGEPSRSLAERRAKRSPLRDVAGMLRSFHYAAHAAAASGDAAAEQWAADSQGAFLAAWQEAAPSLAPGLGLLPLFSAEKALYELAYELNNRPDWIRIPLQALA